MVVAKWKTTMERLELKIHVKNSLIKIDEIQRHKGKLIVSWSTKMEETKPGFELGENPTLLECYLASEQSEKLIINYRFKRNRPVCEPVQLLAKVGTFQDIETQISRLVFYSDHKKFHYLTIYCQRQMEYALFLSDCRHLLHQLVLAFLKILVF